MVVSPELAVGETEHVVREFLTGLSTEDLEAMAAILQKYSPDVAELAESGELRLGAGPVGASSRQR